MEVRPQLLAGGELNAAVSREVTRVHNASLGKGPSRTIAFHYGNVVVAMLEDAMTSGERTLVGDGHSEAVLESRRLYQRAMEDELRKSIGRLTARQVTAFISGNHLEPDLAVEVFVLDGPVPSHPPS